MGIYLDSSLNVLVSLCVMSTPGLTFSLIPPKDVFRSLVVSYYTIFLNKFSGFSLSHFSSNIVGLKFLLQVSSPAFVSKQELLTWITPSHNLVSCEAETFQKKNIKIFQYVFFLSSGSKYVFYSVTDGHLFGMVLPLGSKPLLWSWNK